MEAISLLIGKDSINVDTEHRAILVVKGADGTVKRVLKSKKVPFRMATWCNQFILLADRTDIPNTYELFCTAEEIPFKQAPQDVQDFILNGGKFIGIESVDLDNLKLYTYEIATGGTAYWIRVGKVNPVKQGEE